MTELNGTRAAQPMKLLVFAIWSALLACAGCTSSSSGNGGAPPTAESPRVSASATPSPVLRGCVPECLTDRGGAGGPITGSYTTSNFLDGFFSADFPEGWEATDDNSNELMFQQPANGYLLFAWVDPFAQLNGHTVRGVRRTPADMINWLLHEPSFVAEPGPSTRIGNSFDAATVDISIARGAHSNPAATGCPSVCVDYFGVPNLSTSPHGLAVPGATRLYFAEIEYGGHKHLLALSVEVLRKPELPGAVATSRNILGSIRIPAAPA